MYVTLRVNDGLNPKSSKPAKAVIVINTDQIPTISEGIILRINGNNIAAEAIRRKVAA